MCEKLLPMTEPDQNPRYVGGFKSFNRSPSLTSPMCSRA